MLLEGKVALVHAAAGQVGRRVAEQFAREGANVWLAGRDTTKLHPLAEALRRSGGNAEVVAIDALDAPSIERGTARVMSEARRLDIEFNAIAGGAADAFIGPATEISPDTFLESFRTVVLSQFLTARAAARHMSPVGQGSIVLLTATPGRGVAPLMAGHSAGHAAIEGLVKCLAAEWGPSGVRVTGLMSGGMPETARIGEVRAAMAKFAGVAPEAMAQMTLQKTQLKRLPTLRQTAHVAAFLASDYAGSLTGTVVNASCGEVVG
jgi:NAD(P)-dependent dehydrogenase (short-subunit alcohol dehydrogenase family)